eukprot:449638-Prorocentrum_minimum.AAC.1
MRQSVGRSSEVIEKLIALNAELMENANRTAFALERARQQIAPLGAVNRRRGGRIDLLER